MVGYITNFHFSATFRAAQRIRLHMRPPVWASLSS
jgi:hypothetical protein